LPKNSSSFNIRRTSSKPYSDLKGASAMAKKTKTPKRRTQTKELPKSKKDLKADALKKVKGGMGWDVKPNIKV
jgi:hypothetical protein